ncbi:MarR family winged helix-turn-helix transcriptional regulator [Streptomyces montanisoli]|uniref:Winged helix-turn-helix transcriptional regulator n=1 Tax=Streptomyces montanisoli TaxID=2798581 RepID=A0A940RTF2_9ACTN|nr:MarR family winged helix-turn-helix transcriptional regulator [Streptomyces montanisoli]MBP0456025.1 winged helix-turn-helix transcriptional regulator [Streptomyces montanisoli]
MEYTSPRAEDLPGFFADLVRCETRLYNALNDRLRERHGIVTSQYEALRHLRDHPGARVADLAAEFAIGVGATSKSVDRLEQRGLAVRQPNPADRRSSLLSLTAEGARLADAAERTVRDGLAELTSGALDGASLTAAVAAVAALRATLERDGAGTPTG